MSHANAVLTPRTRLRLARLVVDQGWTCASAAKMFMVSRAHGQEMADRYRAEGVAGMADRSSRPHRCPTKTPEPVKKQIVRLRWRHRLGPVQIAGRLAMPASTVHAVLVRCRINRLSRIDRVSCQPLRRYEHDHPGSLIHVNVTKFGNIPDGGGWRYVGKQAGRQEQVHHRAADRPHGQGPPEYRHRLPAHRHRRPLPGRVRRDLRRREGHHRDRGPAPSGRLVRPARRQRRTRPVRQRLRLQVPRLAQHLR